LCKETTGAVDGARIHDRHITSQTRDSMRHIVSVYMSLN